MIDTQKIDFPLALRLISELNDEGAEGFRANALDLSPSQALHIKYRILLSRAPDPHAVKDMQLRDSEARLLDVVRALESNEFHVHLHRHIDRLRNGSQTPFHWHFHLPRTAGSKFIADWQNQGGHVLRLPLHNFKRVGGWKNVARELYTLYESFSQEKKILVSGHILFRHADPFFRPGDFAHATVRHPVERALSLYRYAVSMCQSSEIVNYPGDDRVRTYFKSDWRENIKAANLDPFGFSLPEFISRGLCPDNQFVRFFAQTDTVEDIGEFMRCAGFNVILQESLPSHELLVNGTQERLFHITDRDREWLAPFLRCDLQHYESIIREYH